MQTKKFWHSKVLWVNVIALVAIILQVVVGDEELAKELLAAEVSILAIVNFILRLITAKGLTK